MLSSVRCICVSRPLQYQDGRQRSRAREAAGLPPSAFDNESDGVWAIAPTLRVKRLESPSSTGLRACQNFDQPPPFRLRANAWRRQAFVIILSFRNLRRCRQACRDTFRASVAAFLQELARVVFVAPGRSCRSSRRSLAQFSTSQARRSARDRSSPVKHLL